MRPPPLVEGRPQERFQRHTVEQIANSVPVVPMLFMVEPQMVEQFVDILSPLDSRDAEQVTVLRAALLAEQLVEVTTIVSLSSVQRIMEQTVDILRGGLQGCRPGQSSSASSSSPAGVHGSADGPSEGVFRTFPQIKKKCEGGFALQSESARQSIHAGSSAASRCLGHGPLW